jgi:hypothetical protein
VSNPYAPPQAALGTADDSPLPRWVRIVRGCAVAGSVLIGMLAPVVLYAALTAPSRDPTRMAITLAACAGVVLFSAVTITALVSRVAERALRWTAFAFNGLAVAWLGYAFFVSRAEAGILLLTPLIINLLAIYELRRARIAKQR